MKAFAVPTYTQRNPDMGFEVNVEEVSASVHKFDYTLKALYEYGNAQYQFTADGAPTKVLPNMVPVGPSPAIPQLK